MKCNLCKNIAMRNGTVCQKCFDKFISPLRNPKEAKKKEETISFKTSYGKVTFPKRKEVKKK